jgi:nickel-type superoxide dismutase maturation protease
MRRVWALVLLATAGSIAVASALRRVDAVQVRGTSMAPTLLPGDRLVAMRLRRPPRIGQIVLAPDPRAPRRELIKRVVRIGPDGVVVHGDNRAATTDSATFGPMPSGSVRWRVVARYWPPGRVGPL